MKNYSSLTFAELTKDLAFIKIKYNGEVIYDDLVGQETIDHLKEIQTAYANKKIYTMKIKVVQGHHCILNIKGEL